MSASCTAAGTHSALQTSPSLMVAAPESIVMRNALVFLLFFALLTSASAAEVGSNANPLTFGKDQTIIDINKAVWGPLKVEGLPEGGEIAVLRGDLSKGDAEVLLKFPPGYKVPNHSHTSDELYIWLSGAFTLIAHDGTRTEFKSPAYISFPGNAPPHGLECGANAPCVTYLKYSRPFDIQIFPEPPPKQ